MSEAMKQFEQFSYDQDRVEAIRIDEIFDQKRAANDYNEALQAAIAEVEIEFTEDPDLKLPGKELVGYTAAKNARHWWMYTTAYLHGLEQAGATNEMSAEQIAIYGREKNYSGDRLAELDPAYFKTFDLLEKERVRRSLEGREDVNPFELARDYSALVLSSALAVTFGELSQGDPNDRSGSLSYQSPKATYFTERTPDKRAKSYIISEYPDGGILDFNRPKAVYIIDGPRDPLGHPIVFETKSGNPIVDACKLLDLVNAVTNYDPRLENLAFEQTAAILQA